MLQPLILHTNEEPTFFNKEAAIGFLAFPPLGVVVGGIIGKNRMEREQTYGKPVGEASAFNKDALLGGLVGWAAGGVAALLIMPEIIAAAAIPTTIMAASIIITLGTAALGAVIGGKQGKETQEKEYALAVAQNHERQASISPSAGKNISYEYGHEVKTSHAATIQAEKTMAQSQQKQV